MQTKIVQGTGYKQFSIEDLQQAIPASQQATSVLDEDDEFVWEDLKFFGMSDFGQ